MTAQRQERNGWRPGLAFIALLSGFAALASLAIAAQAATTERVVVDRYTGLALGGFDPVAYFTDARPLAGQPGFPHCGTARPPLPRKPQNPAGRPAGARR